MDKPCFDATITFLYTRDLEESIDFYENKLGLECVYTYGRARIYRASKDGHIGIFERKDMPEQSRDYGDRNVVFTFVTEDVDGWFERLKEKGVEPADPPAMHQEYGVYSGFIHDPSGYFLEIQRFANPNWQP